MRRLLIAAAALSLLGGTAASAQSVDGDRGGRGERSYNRDGGGRAPGVERGRDGGGERGDRGGRDWNRGDRGGDRNWGDRGEDRRDRNWSGRSGGDRFDGRRDWDRGDRRYGYDGRGSGRFRAPAYVYPRGYGYRRWARGQYLPRAFFAPSYYVDDWSYYGLGPPPYGYRYVRYGEDVVLAAIATGLIANVFGGMFY